MRFLLSIVVLLGLLLAGLNTPAGFRALEAAAGEAGVRVTGLGGRFPDRLTARSVAIADSAGPWLDVRNLVLDWSPSALLHGALAAATLQADSVTVQRWPAAGGGTSSGGFDVPDIALDHLQVDHVVLPEGTLSVNGALHLGAHVQLRLDIASADVRGTGPAALHATLSGPRDAAVLDATAHAAGTDLTAAGTLNLDHPGGRLTLASGKISVGGASVERIAITLSGTGAAAEAHATLTGLQLPGPRPTVLGADPITLEARYGPDLSLNLQSATAQFSLRAPVPGAAIAADWRLVLPDLAAFSPDLAGTAILAGQAAGTADNLAVHTTLDGRLASGPIRGDITVRGLPDAPVAAATVQGSWNGTEIALEAGAARGQDGVFHVNVPRLTALGLDARALLAFDPAQGWPTGTVLLHADRVPMATGTLDATLDLTAPATATLSADARGLGLSSVSVAAARLAATVTDALGTPRLKAQLDATPLRRGPVTETLRLNADGPANALTLRLSGAGSADVQAAALLDTAARRLTLSALQVTAGGPTLRLTVPARLDYAAGFAIDRLRLGLGAASLDIAGRVAPSLALTASLRALPLSLARLFDPALALQGTLQADATLRGSTARPTGSIHLAAAGVRLAGAGFVPPASLAATAAFEGTQARIDASAKAGPTALTVSGTVPLDAGAYDLRAAGHASLALLDPLLAAAGQQARGMLSLEASFTGTTPRLAGHASLTGGSFVDAAQGLRLSDITASAHADDSAFVLDSLTARAGGSITAAARLDRTGDQALTATLTARDITPLTSDALNARLSADLTASGTLAGGLAAAGTIRLARADIRIPDRLPASLPTLTLRQAHPPPPPTPLPIALDITLLAPDQVFLRGRGIDAELGGRVHLGGTAAAPQPQGGFTLRQGQVALAGQTLRFTTGRVSLDGHVPIDPTLDFTARAQGTSVIATLAVTGTASRPQIALTSVPSLPQDEVLAQLLFHQSAASLGPLQIAQIATGLAQLTDIGGASRFDPVGSVRERLGLDTLSVGGTGVLEGGRSIARGVTVGARQSLSGTGTQATVRLDLAKGLRLEADVGVAPPVPSTVTQGAAPTGNQVGLTYEFEY